jgi:hypothetical protein
MLKPRAFEYDLKIIVPAVYPSDGWRGQRRGDFMIQRWKAWIAAFDAACKTDEWAPLEPFLTSDCVYIVAGAPFACELRGREAVIAGFQKSVRNFDRKFDVRHWEGVGIRAWSEHVVTARSKGGYERAGCPSLSFSAKSAWFFRGDQICLMTDTYDLAEIDVLDSLEWLARYGADLNPSYV